MNKTILSFSIILITLLVGCTNNDKVFETSFEGKNILASIELLEVNDDSISFISDRTDYAHTNSAVYNNNMDINNSDLEEELIHKGSNKNVKSKIESNDSWAVIEEIIKDNGYYTNIYVYDVKKGKKILLKEKIPCKIEGSYYKLNTTLYKDKVFWLKHDMDEKKSKLYMYNLTENSEKVLLSFDFLENGEVLDFPTTFFIIDNGKLIYDFRNSSSYNIKIQDINKNKTQDTLTIDNSIALFFGGDFDHENNLLAVYYLVKEEEKFYEAVGYLDVNEETFEEVLKLNKYEALYNDRIQLVDGKLIFNKQLNVSGNVYDHYLGVIMDTKSEKVQTFKGSFELKAQKGYITNLSFDPSKGVEEEIHLDIIKQESVLN